MEFINVNKKCIFIRHSLLTIKNKSIVYEEFHITF